MHLADRGGREGLGLDLREELVIRLVVLLLEHLADLLPRHRRRRGAQLAELLLVELAVLSTWLEDGTWTPGKPARQILTPGTILGQTLEPRSPAPTFPFAVAFVEPALGDALLRPDTMAKVEVRSRAGDYESQWSAPVWVHFLPDMGASVEVDGKPVPAFTATSDAQGVLLTANAAAGPAGKARIDRLISASEDGPPRDAVPGPYIVAGVMAVLVRTIDDATGKRRPRVAAIVPGKREGDGLRFAVPDGIRPSHLRLLEVQRVTTPAVPLDDGRMAAATGRWFGEEAPRHIDGGPHGSLDINERVVGVGPLVAIAPEGGGEP